MLTSDSVPHDHLFLVYQLYVRSSAMSRCGCHQRCIGTSRSAELRSFVSNAEWRSTIQRYQVGHGSILELKLCTHWSRSMLRNFLFSMLQAWNCSRMRMVSTRQGDMHARKRYRRFGRVALLLTLISHRYFSSPLRCGSANNGTGACQKTDPNGYNNATKSCATLPNGLSNWYSAIVSGVNYMCSAAVTDYCRQMTTCQQCSQSSTYYQCQ